MAQQSAVGARIVSWEYCLICEKPTEPHLRMMGVLDHTLGAVHKGECWVAYCRLKGKL